VAEEKWTMGSKKTREGYPRCSQFQTKYPNAYLLRNFLKENQLNKISAKFNLILFFFRILITSVCCYSLKRCFSLTSYLKALICFIKIFFQAFFRCLQLRIFYMKNPLALMSKVLFHFSEWWSLRANCVTKIFHLKLL